MPPPRGNAGLDFGLVFGSYVFLLTFILAIAGWFTAFIGQIVATNKFGHGFVGVGWFNIFLQLFIILGTLHTLASDAIAMHRFQLSIFTAVALALGVEVVNSTIYADDSSLEATGAGWLLLCIVDIIWLLYLTSEEDSLQLHIFNSLGTAGLTPPGRHRRRATMNRSSMANNNTYGGGGISGGGPNASTYGVGGGYASGAPANTTRSTGGGEGLNGGIGNTSNGAIGATAPLMTPAGAGDTSVGSHQTAAGPEGDDEGYRYKAKALYAYTASPDDPNEVSFAKGEILEIIDNAGKWWQARKADGTRGIAPSNYLQMI